MVGLDLGHAKPNFQASNEHGMRDDTKDDTQEISRTNYLLPRLVSNNELHFASTKKHPSK